MICATRSCKNVDSLAKASVLVEELALGEELAVEDAVELGPATVLRTEAMLVIVSVLSP